jgi:hypothetical protein
MVDGFQSRYEEQSTRLGGGRPMTRGAARSGMEYYLGRLVKHAYDTFDVGAALRGTTDLGGGILGALLDRSDTLETRVVEPELDTYRRRAMAQFESILDYAEADDPLAVHRDRLLADDQYLAALDEAVPTARRETIEAALLERAVGISEAVAPIVAAPHDDFWPAVVYAFDEGTARESVRRSLSFTGPLKQFPDAFTFVVTIDPADILGPLGVGVPSFSVEYTDEATRCLSSAETAIRREVARDVTRRYGSTAAQNGGSS